MEYRKIASLGKEISRIGFGCWAAGGSRWGKVDDDDTIASILMAWELGVNLFDTADVYGFGHSEEILGRALGGHIKDAVVATKFGVRWDGKGETYRDCSPQYMVRALEGSLRRLKLDCIPVYQVHWPDGKTQVEDIMAALLECKRSGKINLIGLSNFELGLVSRALSVGRVACLQEPYNLLQRQVESSLFPLCRENSIAMLAYQPLMHGLLSGKYDAQTVYQPDDFRRNDSHFSGRGLAEAMDVVRLLRVAGDKCGKMPGQVALKWVLTNQLVDCAIVGCRTSAQVIENLDIFDFSLSMEDYDILGRGR